MASNRDPQKDYRINRRGRKVTSSADRSKRSNKASAPKPTSSSTRSRGKGTGSRKVTSDKQRVTKNPVSKVPRGAQGPATPPVQGPYRKPQAGLMGSRGSSPKAGPKTQGAPKGISFTRPNAKPATPKSKGSGSGIKTTLTAGMVTALAAGSLRNPVSKQKKKEASKSVGKYNTKDADGTVRSRKKVGPKKVGPKKVGTIAEAFDKAYAAAKKAGKKEFTFKGKRYNTKTA